jgi:hypothetical protein
MTTGRGKSANATSVKIQASQGQRLLGHRAVYGSEINNLKDQLVSFYVRYCCQGEIAVFICK